MNSDLLYPPTLPSLAERLYSSSPSPFERKGFSDVLEQSIDLFQIEQNEKLQSYLDAVSKRSALPNAGLYILQETRLKNDPSLSQFPHAWKTENVGGYYIRWNGKGIVLNPGPHFLDYFHKQGLHIKDIDFVIVTQANPQAYADIKDIHDISAQLSKMGPNLQIIHYYMLQSAYEALSTALKPHFKQQRNTVHQLEFFIDSPEVEKIELSPDIVLHYFSHEKQHLQSFSSVSMARFSSLGIRLDLLQEGKQPLRLGYISGTHWTPFLAHDLESCDLLIAGFGNTSSDDYRKIRYNEDCLGYFGCFTLLEELRPKVMFCTEFDGRNGDIRLNIIKKMQQEFASMYVNQVPTVIPANAGLFLDLQQFKVTCSSTRHPVDLQEIRTVKTGGSFQPFLYLSPECWM